MSSSKERVAAYNSRYERLLNIIKHGREQESTALFSTEKYSVNLEIEYVFEDRMLYKITPLNWAVRYNKPSLCQYLLDHGARPYNNLVYEYYPLHEACSRGFDKVVAVFIAKRCDLNIPTPDDKDTALHIACVKGNIGCVHLLLGANANPYLRNATGHTPLEAAVYHNQDDLVKLFSAYGVSSHGRPNCGPGSLQLQTNSWSSANHHGHVTSSTAPANTRHHSLPQRRHSVSSPTSPTTSVVKDLFASVRPHSRPSSVLINDYDPGFDFRPATTRVNSLPNGKISTIVPNPKTIESFPRTTAPSISPLAQIENGFSEASLRPSYITQLSVASPGGANSPSPVDKDGLMKDSRSLPYYSSASGKFDQKLVSPSKMRTSTKPYNSSSCGKLTRHPEPSITSPGFEQTTVRITPAAACLSHSGRPKRKHLGDHETTSTDSYTRTAKPLLCESNSSPEFSLTAQCTQLQETRTHSVENLFSGKKTLNLPQNSAPAEAKTPSPSRERINILAHCLSSALESVYSGQGAANTVQKLSEDIAKAVNLTPEHLKSLIELSSHKPAVLANRIEAIEIPRLTPGLVDHPAEAMREFGLDIEDHPREVKMAEPGEGHMTVVFNIRSSQNSREVVKISLRVFNLRDPAESNLYHSSASEEIMSAGSQDNNEVLLLEQLSQNPHPNIAQIQSHFTANVGHHYDRFAQQLSHGNHDKLYVTSTMADCIVLSMPSKSLRSHFEESTDFTRDVSEKKLLFILAQVLLGIAQLNRNGISHNSITADNVFINNDDRDTVVISNFNSAIPLVGGSLHGLKYKSIRVAPEVRETIETFNSDDSVELSQLLKTSDSYAAAQMIYELKLGPNHNFIRGLDQSCHSYEHIPNLDGFSSLSNHLLKKLFAYEASERINALEGAVCCLVLLFGPFPSQMSSVMDCKEWLLAETVEFYLRPSLKDISNSDYTDPLDKLHCMYLTVGNSNPSLIWNSCKFFQDQVPECLN